MDGGAPKAFQGDPRANRINFRTRSARAYYLSLEPTLQKALRESILEKQRNVGSLSYYKSGGPAGGGGRRS